MPDHDRVGTGDGRGAGDLLEGRGRSRTLAPAGATGPQGERAGTPGRRSDGAAAGARLYERAHSENLDRFWTVGALPSGSARPALTLGEPGFGPR